jgi:hypothetical protein
MIIILIVILIVLIGILLFLLFNNKDNNVAVTVNKNDSQTSGITEINDVTIPIVEEDIQEKVAENKEEETQEIIEEQVEIVKEEDIKEVVYENMSLDELAEQLNKSLNDDLTGKGYLYASYSLERGVDPYLAVAISLEETGCTWGCSGLVKSCHNVGGMKGYGCGSYGYFETLDDGIKAFIDNISNNYVAYGLTTAELMNPKYAENPNWASNVNAYINRIRNK